METVRSDVSSKQEELQAKTKLIAKVHIHALLFTMNLNYIIEGIMFVYYELLPSVYLSVCRTAEGAWS